MRALRSDEAFEVLVARVCEAYGIDRAGLLGRGREIYVSWPRQVLCYLLREHRHWMLEEIAVRVDRDHSTVGHAVAKVPRVLASDADEAERVRGIIGSAGRDGLIVTADAALREVEDAAVRLETAVSNAVGVLNRLEGRARELRALVVRPVITRGAA